LPTHTYEKTSAKDKEQCGQPSTNETDKSVEIISDLIQQEGISLFIISVKKMNVSYRK
jgi:hypothetical protein